MAARKAGLIALFDVDGTLTAPRKVWIFCFDLINVMSFCTIWVGFIILYTWMALLDYLLYVHFLPIFGAWTLGLFMGLNNMLI